MSRALEIGEVKALFRQLVSAAGGVEASGVVLSVSHQRISQLQNVNHPDMPTLMQVMALEVVAERSIILGAAARAVEGRSDGEIEAAAVAAVTQGAACLQLVHDMDADNRRDTHEIRRVQSATQVNADAARRLADAAARLTPTG